MKEFRTMGFAPAPVPQPRKRECSNPPPEQSLTPRLAARGAAYPFESAYRCLRLVRFAGTLTGVAKQVLTCTRPLDPLRGLRHALIARNCRPAEG